MEKWLQHRHHSAEFLRARAHASGSKDEVAAWEQYARQTARMQATADHLTRTLGSAYAVASGLRVSHQGREIYLEHLVIGPTGVYLVESTEGDDAPWRQDLVRNLEFFQRALGTHASFFTCLVLSRTFGQSPLPPGAHLVDSLDVAIDVIRDQRSHMTMPPALAQELWHLVAAMEIRDPAQPLPVIRRTARLEYATLAAPVATGLLVALTLVDALSGLAALVAFGLPTVIAWLFIRRIEREGLRKGWLIASLIINAFFFLLLLFGAPADASPI